MTTKTCVEETELQITAHNKEPIILKGELSSLHNNPQKIHQLLDLLEMPKGTEVKVSTRASSVIVR